MNKNKINTIILASLLMSAFAAHAQSSEIYRYKDKNGNFIYTDKSPIQKGLEVGVLSKKTGVIKNMSELEAAKNFDKNNEEFLAKEAEIREQEKEQLKKDQYLLNTYSSTKDIDQIKQYELDQIDRSIQNDINIISTLKDRRDQLEKEIKTNPKLKAEYDKEYIKLNENIERSQTNLNKSKEMYKEREKKFNDEKERLTAVLKIVGKNSEEKK